MYNTKFDYLILKFKNEVEFIFEISSATRGRLEEEISHANNDSPKFIFFETCDIRKVYFSPEHLQVAYFESRPHPSDADESIENLSLVVYTTTSSEPFFANQDGLDVDSLFLELSDDKTNYIHVKTSIREFKLINVKTIALAMSENDQFD